MNKRILIVCLFLSPEIFVQAETLTDSNTIVSKTSASPVPLSAASYAIVAHAQKLMEQKKSSFIVEDKQNTYSTEYTIIERKDGGFFLHAFIQDTAPSRHQMLGDDVGVPNTATYAAVKVKEEFKKASSWTNSPPEIKPDANSSYKQIINSNPGCATFLATISLTGEQYETIRQQEANKSNTQK